MSFGELVLDLLTRFALAPYHIAVALFNPGAWLNWADKEALARFIFYGASVEFFFAIFFIFLVITIVGLFRNGFLWGAVRVTEAVGNTVGRVFAWAGLLMVLQQVMIVFLQRIFRAGEISFGPFGINFTRDISWWAEELKLYNAAIVCLCVSYTFIQGGHVRVDLVYSAVKFRTKKVIDMVGCFLFMLPAITLTYMYAWFFMWRHLVLPGPSANQDLDRILRGSAVMRWNVETIGFSPNGFDAYFLFKILIVGFCVLVYLQAWSFFWRSYLEFREGEPAAGKHLDKDKLGDEEAELAAEIH